MIEIIFTSGLASIQDSGRHNHLRYGVGTAGAMDQVALAVGNILLGNSENAASIEIPMFPFQLRFLEDTCFSLTGADAGAELDGQSIPPYWVRHAKKDQELTLFAPRHGARVYLGLAGGVNVPLVLGSRSTQLRGEFGGHHGRPLRQGDVITAGALTEPGGDRPGSSAMELGAEPPEYALPLGDESGAGLSFVRVLPAAEYDYYERPAIDAFWTANWKITAQSDRYGYRLAGPVLNPTQPLELRSHGIVPGVIQVPHNGQPIIQLRDAQPSGGYPKIGTVIEADLWRLAQARPGTQLRFVRTSYDEARLALLAVRDYLGKLRQLTALCRLSQS